MRYCYCVHTHTLHALLLLRACCCVFTACVPGTVSTLTLQQFKEILKGAPKLRHILRLLMVPHEFLYIDAHWSENTVRVAVVSEVR